MYRPSHKTLGVSVGILTIGFLALWLFYTFKTEDYRQSGSPENSEAFPVESGRNAAKVSKVPKHSEGNEDSDRYGDGVSSKYSDLPEFNMEEELRGAKERSLAKREEQLAMEVSKESTAEKVRNLLYKTHWVGDPLMESDFASGSRYISTLEDNPRVKSLVKLATDGSDSEKKELLDNLTKMCRVYLEELPLLGDPNAPWEPTVRCPGGGKAFPYLLTHVDEDGSTLGLLARMYLRMQKALKQYHKVDDDEWFSSKNGLVFAYACDHFLNIYSNRTDLQKRLPTGQLAVLKEYSDHRKSRPKDWNLDVRQCDVMEFAVTFVEGESEGGDGEMR